MSRSEITDKGGTKTTEFKVGDEVRLLRNTNYTTCFKVGDILEVVEPHNGDFKVVRAGGGHYACQIVSETQIELVGGVKPKSEWFGFKYKVNPETSKLLQEAVFKDGGSWEYESSTTYLNIENPVYWILVDGGGKMNWIEYPSGTMPEKAPPRAVTGYDLSVGKDLSVVITRSSETNNFKPNDFSITKEEVNMSNQNRVVSVKFFDDDAGLKAEDSLVVSYEVVTRTSNEMTVSKVLLTEDVAGAIAHHNEKRENTIDQHIRKQTGNEVYLLPIEFEDLRVVVSNI